MNEVELRHLFECHNCQKMINLDNIQVDARILIPQIIILCPYCKTWIKYMALVLAEEE